MTTSDGVAAASNRLPLAYNNKQEQNTSSSQRVTCPRHNPAGVNPTLTSPTFSANPFIVCGHQESSTEKALIEAILLMLPIYAVCSFCALLLSEMPSQKYLVELLEGAPSCTHHARYLSSVVGRWSSVVGRWSSVVGLTPLTVDR